MSLETAALAIGVLSGTPWDANLGSLLYDHLTEKAIPLFQAAQKERAKVQSPEQWRKRRRWIVETFKRCIGPFPERTPLNARMTGRLQRDGYVVEKVIFESRPSYYVTANLYIPTNRAFPLPGVLVPCGHSDNGKAMDTYQSVCQGLVKKGYVVLIYDPCGQGERKQYWDPEKGASRIGGPTSEHAMVGYQCYLAGINLANLMIWDSIRAIDYLCSRLEVDPGRIGCTGCSGGGTNTSWVTPLDERIKAASTVCFITTLEQRTLSTIIADPEQNPLPAIKLGLDHHDISAAVAPHALQICAAVGDFFPIEGTREAAAEARRIYEMLGIGERFNLFEAPGEHGYQQPHREATYAWMNKWLDNEDEDSQEPELHIEMDEDLWCTETGQVATSLGGETPFTVVRRYAETILPPPPILESRGQAEDYCVKIRDRSRQLIGFAHTPASVQVQVVDKQVDDGLQAERLFFESEPGMPVPCIALRPEAAGRLPAVLYLDERGKAADIEILQTLARAGFVVLAADVRGVGETASREGRSYDQPESWAQLLLGAEANCACNAFLIGTTILGLRTFDVARCVDYLVSRDDVDPSRISVIGVGDMGLVALHAGALDSRIAVTVSDGALATYRSIVFSEIYRHPPASFVPGVLAEYDLPDVAATIAPRRLAVVNPTDAMRIPLDAAEAHDAYATAVECYRLLECQDRITVQLVPEDQRAASYLQTLQR